MTLEGQVRELVSNCIFSKIIMMLFLPAPLQLPQMCSFRDSLLPFCGPSKHCLNISHNT